MGLLICSRSYLDVRVGGGFEQALSRILSLCCLAAAQVAIIYLGRRLPGASSDLPGG